MSDIKARLSSLRNRIIQAEQQYNRATHAVTLLAVSKTWPASAIKEAIQAGQTCFGENYVQEAVDKITRLADTPEGQNIEWHFIGAIQSNKTKDIAQHFQWVHSVDRLKIAQRLNDQRPADLLPLNVCLQINISDENSKAGVQTKDIETLAQQVAQMPNLRLRGLMAIPAQAETFDQQRTIFHQMADLQKHLLGTGLALDTLSMGMSSDMDAAIAEGATIVRVGRAIFGARNSRPKTL